MAYLDAYVVDRRIYWEIGGLSNPFNTTYYIYGGIYGEPCSNGQSDEPSPAYDGEWAYEGGTDYSVSGSWLRNYGDSFTLYGAVQAANGLWYPTGSPVYVEIYSPKPDNWYWWSYVAQGADINISANEWNSFADRVNEFRDYKGLYPYGFTTVYSGQDIYAYMMNQAINAIDDMNPPISVPNLAVSKVTTITADYFNDIRDSLNSID